MIRSPNKVSALNSAKMGTPMTMAHTDTLMPCQFVSSMASETTIIATKSSTAKAPTRS